MFLLDTNAFDLLIAGDVTISHHVEQNRGRTWLSSVAAEERLTGYLSSINRARASRTSLSLARAHEDFTEALKSINTLPILPFSEEADAIYQSFPASIKRIGAQDCRIAAQAIAHGLTVVSRNGRDFAAIGAPCVDWSSSV